ncbi:hypothetical protein Sgly_0326 [Syntrophobotulus glycolicus DSM 8271]|uniref:Uncharacterized protein n=1 Tax=Syntrophobotulus glycolicus (strain DSM 8271 / FlGlyR) TaxID=645991 RepID=F0SXE6_SYNGF|nr:hypothetical protein Sgly_0326 [Syntrophobotulus glycolicus DSM 8271]
MVAATLFKIAGIPLNYDHRRIADTIKTWSPPRNKKLRGNHKNMVTAAAAGKPIYTTYIYIAVPPPLTRRHVCEGEGDRDR